DPVDYNMTYAAKPLSELPGVDIDAKLMLPRIQIPANVHWSDVYYRQDPGYPDNFTGEAIETASINIDLTGLGLKEKTLPVLGNWNAHSTVHKWYLGTILADDTASAFPIDDERFAASERSEWYNTEKAEYRPISGQPLGQGGGLGEGWYWSLPGGGSDAR